jgi:hypothetical protein
MDKRNDSSRFSQRMDKERKTPEVRRWENAGVAVQDPFPGRDAPKEDVERWEDEGGHLIENGNGRN